jgi:hypothetical protein
MIRKAISLILIFTYLAVNFQPALKYFAFIVNQKFIVNNLCVEKDFKINSCQGSCYLNAEMQKSSESDSKSTVPLKEEITKSNFDFIIQEENYEHLQLLINSHIVEMIVFQKSESFEPLIPPPKFNI